MSIKNNSQNEKINNKCNHDELINKKESLNQSYFYCFKCNHIILIDDNQTYSVFKFFIKDEIESKNKKIEIDPILVIRAMIERQEDQIKDINDKLVLNFSNNSIIEEDQDNINKNNYYINEKINESNDNTNEEKKEETKIKVLKKVDSEIISIDNSINKKGNNKFTKIIFDEEIFNKYCEQRNRVLIYIHKLCTKLKYNDSSFYTTLYLADTYLSKIFTDDISEKELFLVILGFFLISSKYIEDDIFEPEFQIFSNILKTIEPLTVDEICMSEVQCLSLINHNLYAYSVYDWLNMLLNNGIVFENEINNTKELDNIYNYTQKLLTVITSKNYFCKYSSMEIAFSIIQLTREKYINKNKNFSEKMYKLLILLYGVEISDYEECYNEIKKDLEESNEMEEDEENEVGSNINLNTNNANSLDINIYSNNSKTLNKDRNNYGLKKVSRKNRFRISVDSNRGVKYIKTDINLNNNVYNKNNHNLISSLDQKNNDFQKRKYKLKNNNYNNSHNHSIGILDNHINIKYTPNIISNINNNSLNNTSVKSCNYNNNINKQNHLMIDCFRNENNLFLNDKNQKSDNTLYINYAPKFLIRNIGTNINYINNISIANDRISLNNGNNKKMQKNNNNTNLNFGYKMKTNRNNNEIRSNTNHILRKTLFKLENIVPIQLNYEYNLNNINNNKIKKDKEKENNNNINKIQNIIPLNNNNIKTNFKNYEKLNPNYKEKFKSHLLLEISNNPNINNIFRNTNNATVIPPNKETKSLNKYTINDKDNINNKKRNNIKINKNQIKIMNTNNNKNINFKDFLTKKNNIEHINKFLLKNNKDNSKRFKSLNHNFYNKDNNKNIEKKYSIFNENKINGNNEENNNLTRNDNFNENITKLEEPKNNIIKNNEYTINNSKNFVINYKNMVSFKSKLPKLRFNKNSVITNK